MSAPTSHTDQTRPRSSRTVATAVVVALIAATLALASTQAPAGAASTYHTDPPATVTNNGPILQLHKELSGYPNYGEADRAADILYTGENNTWTFNLGGFTTPTQALRLRVRLVLDDHYSVPDNDYRGRITVNGAPVWSGSFASRGVEHGAPFGQIFDNWTTLSVPLTFPVGASAVTIGIANTSTSTAGGDWVAIDWVQLDVVPLSTDADGDTVLDANDLCPGTPLGTKVAADGCPTTRLEVIEAIGSGLATGDVVNAYAWCDSANRLVVESALGVWATIKVQADAGMRTPEFSEPFSSLGLLPPGGIATVKEVCYVESGRRISVQIDTAATDALLANTMSIIAEMATAGTIEFDAIARLVDRIAASPGLYPGLIQVGERLANGDFAGAFQALAGITPAELDRLQALFLDLGSVIPAAALIAAVIEAIVEVMRDPGVIVDVLLNFFRPGTDPQQGLTDSLEDLRDDTDAKILEVQDELQQSHADLARAEQAAAEAITPGQLKQAEGQVKRHQKAVDRTTETLEELQRFRRSVARALSALGPFANLAEQLTRQLAGLTKQTIYFQSTEAPAVN